MIAISRHERDRLRHQLTDCMGGIEDLFMLAEQGRRRDPLFEARRRYWTAMHLLDDLGWAIRDARETFYVTLPTAEFRSWLEVRLEIVEEAMLSHSYCFAVAGHLYPEHHSFTEDEAAELLCDSRRQADEDLDLRAVCVAILDRLTEGDDA
jgi:hypothetical protein